MGNLNSYSVVTTLPVIGWKDFISQRTRWASNAYWKDLNPLLFLILGVNYLINLLVGAGIIFISLNLTLSIPIIALVVYKFITELAFYRIASIKLDRNFHFRNFVGWFILVTPYVFFIGILGGFGNFKWKEPKVKLS